jgi:hypothetical protein
MMKVEGASGKTLGKFTPLAWPERDFVVEWPAWRSWLQARGWRCRICVMRVRRGGLRRTGIFLDNLLSLCFVIH